mgnify:FL=1
MNLDLTGKTALVCGSSQGIGKATAEVLADLGANVVLFARNADRLQQALTDLNTNGNQDHSILVADFDKPEQVRNVADKFINKSEHPIDILVNNSGGPPSGPILDASPSDFLLAIHRHLICNQLLAQLVVPGMKQKSWGRIVNIISTSVKAPLANLGVSNTTRGAVASWSKTLAGEIGAFNITVNNVLPGATNTERLHSIIKNKAEKSGATIDEVTKQMQSIIPSKRFGTSEEIANVVAFLCSPAADYVNGTSIPVDGGRTKSF